MQNQSVLFTPYQLGKKPLRNRIVMAPMTRNFADSTELTPTEAMAQYYSRRQQVGLIITEGTLTRPGAAAFSAVPGIYSDLQVTAWQRVTQTVHATGGLIYLQLWDLGRASHPHFSHGETPISASATSMTGPLRRNKEANLSYVPARAATAEDIEKLTELYVGAATNALRAGFDGVEIHGANGYLLDQFLHYDTNHRSDEYGGTPEKMARFPLEVIEACGAAVGFDNVSIRLSPGAYLNEIKGDPRDANVFKYVLERLNDYPLSYVHTGNFDDRNTFPELGNLTMTQFMRQYYRGTLIACGSYTPESASEHITKGDFDLIAFGRPFIANPNLVSLIQQQAVMKPYDVSMLETLV